MFGEFFSGETEQTPEEKDLQLLTNVFPAKLLLLFDQPKWSPFVDKSPSLCNTFNELFSASPLNINSDKDYQKKAFRLKKRGPINQNSKEEPGANKDNVGNR